MESIISNKYVNDVVWLPTYLSLILILITSIENDLVFALLLFPALITTRMILELVYRIIFNEQRLTLQNNIIALLSQAIVWGIVLYSMGK